jgi:hypothetical protein
MRKKLQHFSIAKTITTFWSALICRLTNVFEIHLLVKLGAKGMFVIQLPSAADLSALRMIKIHDQTSFRDGFPLCNHSGIMKFKLHSCES